MKPLKLLLFFLLSSSQIYAQAPIAFERYYDFGYTEEGYCVQQTNDGGYIVTGRQTQGIGFSKMLLQKTDSFGNTQWTKFIGNVYENEGYSVKQTSDSGYIITGYTTDANYTNFVFLVKTDVNGNILWSKNNISRITPLPQGGPGNGYGKDVIQTPDGGYLISANITDYDTSRIILLIKTDSIGDTLWTKKIKRLFGVVGYSLRMTKDSGFVIAGATVLTNSSSPPWGIYLVKTDTIGDTLWSKIITPSSNNPRAYSVVQTFDWGYFLTGTVYDPVESNFKIDIIKTDSIGDTLWTKKIGTITSSYDGYGGGRQTNDLGYIVSGCITNTITGNADVCLVKTDSDGILQWIKTFGGSNYDFGDWVEQTSDHGFIISGITSSFGNGNGDVYLIKTDSLGNAPTGILQQINPQNAISVFPNPFSVSATVELLGDIFNQKDHFILYDVAGKEVMNVVPDTTEFTIQRNDLPSGIYFYSLTGNENETLARGKIIIQ
ncbi:MAG: T9SS type A sorting domain-containing protein [Bacteroidetes bacterium]|nr:T9SS type A sorting domain-containing protein [Bacteroidota bacterium]